MRVAVILHERLGGWNRQLRPRLSALNVRWFESRTTGDLGGILEGLASPVVLIDLARQPIDGLTALELVRDRAPGARILVLDPESRPGVADLARELGAAVVRSGFAPPPEVTAMVARWVGLARTRIGPAGWSRTNFAENPTEPWGWLSEHLAEKTPTPAATANRVLRPGPRSNDSDRLLPTGDHD